MLRHFLATLYRRNRLLTVVGWMHVAVFVATIVLMLVDERQVLGVNTWVKPMKFMFSLSIYLWTIAWLGHYIKRPRWRLRSVSSVIAVVIIIESACLLIQAARGTASHFNQVTDFDAAIFQTMGLMIAIDMLMGFVILLMFSRPTEEIETTYLWGIRLGLAFFLVGGAVGVVMINNNAHTFGAADGGPGLPFLNWSTTAGDMRIAHGLALHALQAMPIAGYLIGASARIRTEWQKIVILAVFFCCYSAAVYGTYMQALSGRPLL